MSVRSAFEERELARDVVATKMAYWRALRQLETATAYPADRCWPASVDTAVLDGIESLANTFGSPAELPDDRLDELVAVASRSA